MKVLEPSAEEMRRGLNKKGERAGKLRQNRPKGKVWGAKGS